MTVCVSARIENILVHNSWTVILLLTVSSNWGRNSVLTETLDDKIQTRRKEQKILWWSNIAPRQNSTGWSSLKYSQFVLFYFLFISVPKWGLDWGSLQWQCWWAMRDRWHQTDCSHPPRHSGELVSTPARGRAASAGGTNFTKNYPIFGLDIRHRQHSTVPSSWET